MGAGAWLAMGVLAALFEREHTGRGQRVDSSLLQTGMMLMAYHFLYREFSGENPVPQGSGHASFAPYGAFHTADGDIIIGVSNDRVFGRLCKAVGRPNWIADPRFATNVLRVQNRSVLNEELQALFAQQSRAHWVAVFDQCDVALGPIQTVEQVMHDPQVEALGLLQRVPLPGCVHESAPVPRLPFSLSETPPAIAGPPPVLGAHAREILTEAGFTGSEIDEFLRTKVCAIP
jgi:crotonobetainyl-CoA:carnitine CoA-transferase CaiB-like acyl-CoA transferase